MNILSSLASIYWNNASECEQFAQKMAAQLKNQIQPDSIFHIWLDGDLGTGKTTFVRYLLRALGVNGKVKSPTYNLCEPYTLQLSPFNSSKTDKTVIDEYTLHHFDLYRMNSPNEWEESGFRDILTSAGICLIEWPDKAEGTLPQADIIIGLKYCNDTSREITLSAGSVSGKLLLEKMSSI